MKISTLTSVMLITGVIIVGQRKTLGQNPQNTKAPFRLVIQNGHGAAINRISYSADGKFFASAGDDRIIKLWNVNGKLLRNITGHKGSVKAVIFHSDLQRIISCSADRTIRIWNSSGDLLYSWQGHKGSITTLALSPDGKIIASGSEDGTVRLWTLAGKLIRTLNEKNAHYVRIQSVGFSPDGEKIAVGSSNYYGRKDHALMVWSLQGKLLLDIKELAGSQVNSVAWSPDGAMMVTGSGTWVGDVADRHIRLWSREGKLLRLIRGHAGLVSSVQFSRDGKSLFSASWDGLLKKWDLQGNLIKIFPKSRVGLNALALSPDGAQITTGSSTFFGEANSIKIYDMQGRLLKSLRGFSSRLTGIDYNPRKKIIATALGYPENSIKLWSLDGKLAGTIKAHFSDVSSVSFSPDGEKILSCGRDFSASLWNMNGQRLRTYPLGGICYDAVFHPDGRTLATASGDHLIRVWSLDGEIEHTLYGHLGNVYNLAYSPDGAKILSGSEDASVRLWDLSENRSRIIFSGAERIYKTAWSPDGKYFAFRIFDTTERIRVHYAEGSFYKEFQGSAFAFDPASQVLATGLTEGRVNLYDLPSGKLSQSMKGAPGAMVFLPDGKNLITASWDTTTKIWNLQTGQYVSFLSAGADWLNFTDDGYFDSSRYGADLIAMVQEKKAFGIDQFAIRYNRPDLILSRLGLPNQVMVDHFYGRYQNRLKKNGINGISPLLDLHVPEVKILQENQRGKKLELQFILRDQSYRLQRYNVYLNAVPLLGAYGKKISGKEKKISEIIELNSGDNRIEISCVNERGAESYRALVHAAYQEQIRGDLYFLGFGISHYQRPGIDLKYAHKDALDLERIFTKMSGKFFRKVFSKTLINSDVTRKKIADAKEFFKKARVDDTIVLFIAGHGMYERTKAATYYYLTHEADPAHLKETAVPFEQIESLLRNILPRKKLFLMDTCESGEMDEERVDYFYQFAGARGIRARTSRALAVLGKKAPGRKYLYQKDRFIYHDLLRRSGAIVFSSSRGGEFSYESDKIQNGFFTSEIIRAFTSNAADGNNDKLISLAELKAFVSRTVPLLTEENQHPTVDRDNIYQKFAFPVSR